ncbi:MAG: UDP-N-acetylmuramoyl-tripeptide--D-alanyl-D-alanine ligase [Candidatus Thiodiazotropha weberae]|nr:UDP-N-acetylmuramoyl-tripeptide--D-alanyl-D-alanine ligase [Candidatus Thiodiazotropha weberae]
MNSLSLAEVAQELEAVHQGANVHFHSVSTDTRTIQPGDLFVALSGPNFDGHRFIGQAMEKGAVAAMVSELQAGEFPQLQVTDTRIGLGRLAALWRDRVEVPIVAITGSNGKTTVKELLASIFGIRGSVLATRGNLNNEIGLPLTLLRLQDEQCAVIEMGANHPGEIGYLSQITRPDVALINNAGAAHLEGFGDLNGVAHAKGEILSGLRPTGIGVLNADDRFFPLWRELCGERQMISFGTSPKADVQSDLSQAGMRWSEQGFQNHMQVSYRGEQFSVQLSLAGRHNLMNALAAIAGALAMECDIEQIQMGLAGVQAVAGRLRLHHTAAGYRLIDDSYNANPDSVDAAIEVLSGATGTRYLVLGDLAELGDEAEALHAGIGERARQAGLEHLFSLGELSRGAVQSFGDGGKAFTELDQLVDALHAAARSGDAVLVKGSRSAGMDRVVERLMSEGRG